jgi:hypothetical protein
MSIETLKPIPLLILKSVMKRFSYHCVLDEHPVLQFEKDGSKPDGYETACQYWPKVVTFRHPDCTSEKYPTQLVYDSSEIVDLLSDFLLKSSPTMTRTEVSRTLKAVLTPAVVKDPEPIEKSGKKEPTE